MSLVDQLLSIGAVICFSLSAPIACSSAVYSRFTRSSSSALVCSSAGDSIWLVSSSIVAPPLMFAWALPLALLQPTPHRGHMHPIVLVTLVGQDRCQRPIAGADGLAQPGLGPRPDG